MTIEKAKRLARQTLELELMRVTTRIEKEVLGVTGKQSHFSSCKLDDKLRLFNLVVWGQRYGISLSAVITILVEHWSNKFKSRRPMVLGTTISTFTGDRSRKVLEEAIAKMYPDNEHRKAKRSDRLVNIMYELEEMQSDTIRVRSPKDFVTAYLNKISSSREALDEQQKVVRNYRGS